MESRRVVLAIVAIILLLEIASTWAIMFALNTWPDRASFGSMFGAISSLFSGMALAGVVYAILLQRQELALQREELQLTRRELQRSATAQEESAKLVESQLHAMIASNVRQEASERARVLPRWKVRNSSTTGDRIDFEIENYGLTIVDLEVRHIQQANFSNQRASIVEAGGVFRTIVETGAPQFSFEIVFTDMHGDRRAMAMSFIRATQDLQAREIAA